jgi:hypothetical protein
MDSNNTESNRPFHEIKLGRVKATLWHETRGGFVRYNVAFSRLFKSAERWSDSAYFQRDDLLVLGKVAEAAYLWIRAQQPEKTEAVSEVPAEAQKEAA